MDRLLFDAIPLPMWVFDRQTRAFLAVNQAAVRHYGFSREEFFAMTVRDVVSEKDVHLLDTAEIPIPGLSNVEVQQHRKKDGTVIDVELTSHDFVFEGREAALALVHDITERKRNEERLRQSEERFSKAFRSSPIAITMSTRSDGRYVDANDAFLRLVDFRREEVIGRTVEELNIWVEPGHRVALIQQLDQSGSVNALQTQFRTRLGEARHVQVSAELIRLDGVPCVLAITEDVTEAQRLEQQLRQAQKMEAVGRLAGGVSHDFNNILGVIIGHAELLEGRVDLADAPRRDVGEIRKAAERAASLTRQLLAFSRQQVLQPRVLDLNIVISNLSSMLRRMIGEDIELVIAPSSELGCVRADPGHIEQIIMNLAVNARDAMPGGGKLTIKTANADLDETYTRQHAGARPGAYVMMSVRDTGEGISPEVMPHIFEPFFTTKQPGKGTGLGLSMVYGVVKQNSGYIWADSEPEKGTTFEIYLPRIDAPALPLEQSEVEATARGGSETILLAEDDEPLRCLTRGVLEGAGYTVLEAQDARMAIEIAEERGASIDLLLTDVIMPGISGRQLGAILRTCRPELRVLYMSGYAGDLLADSLEPDSALIEKPFTNNALLVKVRRILDVSSAAGGEQRLGR